MEVTSDPATNEIIQENHYYPFGLSYGGSHWMNDAARDNGYKYNGKELNEDWGLGWYDYGARWYMPDLGRWGAVDPSQEKYFSISPFNYANNNPLKFIDPDGRDAIVTIDKKKKDIQVQQVFHLSRENLNSNLKGVPNSDASGQITLAEFISNLTYDYNKEWGSVSSAELNGEIYSVNFSAHFEFHDTDKQRDEAVAFDQTTNNLIIDRSFSGQGRWGNVDRKLTLNPLSMIGGSFSHEVAHSLGIEGDQMAAGTGRISSYDQNRSVKPEEVQTALLDAVKLAATATNPTVKVHLKGHTTQAWKQYDPNKIIKDK